MGQVLTDVLNANIELVRTGALPRIYQLNPELAVQRVCKNAESHRITKTTNGADFRAPIEFAPPGTYGAVNLDGGALGLGSGFSVAQFIQTFFTTKMGFQMTYQSVKGTATSEQSVLNVWTRTMEEGLPNMARYENISWHNIGGQDGKVGVTTAVTASPGAGGTYTLDTDVGARFFIPGQRFEILSSDGLTWKTGQTGVSPDFLPYVNPGGVNYNSRQITFTCPVTLTAGNVPAAGDILYLAGATPAGVPTWLQGLKYVNSTATSGNYLGLSRTTYPSLNATTITTGGTLTPAMVLAFRQQLKLRCGSNAAKNEIGLVSPQQIGVMSGTVQAMQTFYRSQVTEKQIDPLPQLSLDDDGVVWGGMVHYEDELQSATTIDYCNTEDWGRVYLDDKVTADFYKNPGDDKMFFPVYSTSNGGPTTSVVFYLVSSVNYYNLRPDKAGVIANLTNSDINTF